MGPDLIIEDELSFPKAHYLNNRIREDGGPPIIALVHHLTWSCDDRCGRKGKVQDDGEGVHPRDGRVHLQQSGYEGSGDGYHRFERSSCGRLSGKDHLMVRSTKKGDRASPRTLSVVYIGNILPHKGLDVLIRALATMEGRDFKLTVIGAGPDVDYILKVMDLIISNDLGENILFLGRTDERTLSKVLGEADVLAGPSYFEGYGISYTEALGHGVPVIATTSGEQKR